jgi:hypothetical protein
MNNTYNVTVKSPLLRPGIVIETTCSEKYLAAVVEKLMAMVREVNAPKEIKP